jgi:hypothetical protein
MKEFMLVFRADYNDISSVSKEETQDRNNRWMEWIDHLVTNNRLAEGGNHLTPEGKVLRGKDITSDGPFREVKESMLGYILIYAVSFSEAIELARACPILTGENTSVEIREIGE